MDLKEYGGLIETMYSQFSEEEIPENIKKLKERIDKLFLAKSLVLLRNEVKKFSENERNYINCVYLDEINRFCILKSRHIFEEFFIFGTSMKVFDLFCTLLEARKNHLLIRAARYGRLEIIKFLATEFTPSVEKNADVNAKDDYALSLAARNGHFHVVKYIVENHKPYISNRYSQALRWAAEKGHENIIKYLIEKGADVHARNDEALRWASSNGHLEVINILLELGADVHAKNDKAIIDASSNGHFDVVFRLIDAGATVDTHNNWALAVASSRGHLDVVKLLVAGGANPNTGLAHEWAVRSGHLHIVQYFVEVHSCDLNRELSTASAGGHLEIIKYLVSKGAIINTSYFGRTPIFHAVSKGHFDVVKYLVENGACISGYLLDIGSRYSKDYRKILDYLQNKLRI